MELLSVFQDFLSLIDVLVRTAHPFIKRVKPADGGRMMCGN